MSHFTTDQVLATPAGELAQQSGESLFQLKNDATDLLTAAKAIIEHIDRALDLKYAERVHALRLAAGKDTGVVHFDDSHVRITVDVPKRVAWDQAQLAEIAQRIAASGDKVSDYIDIDYSVSESRFNAWPATLKESFAKARTIKPGKASYRLAFVQENQQ